MYKIFEQLLQKHNVTAYKISKEIDVSQSTLSDWKRGRSTPKQDKLQKIADYFDVSLDYLMTGKHARQPNKGVRIPVLGRVPAGVPIEAVEEFDIDDWEEIPEEWTHGGQEYFALRVQGDSMYPKYLEGDIIIVRKTPQCDSGKDAVIYINGYDATLKTVILNADYSITLRPLNPEYSPRTYSKEEIFSLPVGICGIVVELRRKV